MYDIPYKRPKEYGLYANQTQNWRVEIIRTRISLGKKDIIRECPMRLYFAASANPIIRYIEETFLQSRLLGMIFFDPATPIILT